MRTSPSHHTGPLQALVQPLWLSAQPWRPARVLLITCLGGSYPARLTSTAMVGSRLCNSGKSYLLLSLLHISKADSPYHTARHPSVFPSGSNQVICFANTSLADIYALPPYFSLVFLGLCGNLGGCGLPTCSPWCLINRKIVGVMGGEHSVGSAAMRPWM